MCSDTNQVQIPAFKMQPWFPIPVTFASIHTSCEEHVEKHLTGDNDLKSDPQNALLSNSCDLNNSQQAG